jgi:hypothetical protein
MSVNFRVHLFQRFAILLFALFVVNSLANHFFWYESFYGFDKVMHFTGGIIGSLFLSWFFYKKYINLLTNKSIGKMILFNSLVFFLAAFMWELMEFSVQGYFGLGHLLATPRDSIGDLAFGLLGSLVGITYFLNKCRNLKIIKNIKNGN